MKKSSSKLIKSVAQHLPRSVYYKNGSYYFVTSSAEHGKQKSTWHRLGTTWSQAFERYKMVAQTMKGKSYLEKSLISYRRGDIPEQHLANLLKQSRNNARARNLEHSITLEDIYRLSAKSDNRCALTGIKFDYGIPHDIRDLETRYRRPWAPSLDRINSMLGYTPENVRLVCIAVNIARQDFPDSILYKLADALSKMPSQRKNVEDKTTD